MKISIAFTANLALENIELPDAQAEAILKEYKETGTISDEALDKIMNDAAADLYVEEILDIEDVCESGDEEE
jgi:hypoxanthine-guanine phosphoribosyltransferase